MSLIPAIQNRHSIRHFKNQRVERDKILSCLEAAHLAPSAENSQPWRFIVLDDPVFRREFDSSVFSGIYKTTQWAMKAPVLIALCANLDFMANRMGKLFQGIPFYLLDIGMAGEHLVLQATDQGLATCWIGWFNIKKARKLLKLPRYIRLCALIAIGYPSQNSTTKPHKRKMLDDFIHWNQW